MYLVLHILITLVCGTICLLAARRLQAKLPKMIMFSALGLIHGVVPALTPRMFMWPGAAQANIDYAALLALLGILAFALGWRIMERSADPQGLAPGLYYYLYSSEGQAALKRLFWATAVLGCAAWLGCMIVSAGSVSAAFSAARFQYRMRGNIYLTTLLTHVSSLMAVPCFTCFFLPRRYRMLGASFGISMALLLFVASQGARAAALGMIGATGLGYSFAHRLRLRRALLVGAVGGAILLLAVATYEVRKVMTRRPASEVLRMLVSPETYQGALTRDPLYYHQFLVAAVMHFPDLHPYLNGAAYQRILFFYLPHRYFPELKPPDTHNTFARVITGSSTRTTIPPTMIGDGYINFWGLPGVIGIMLFHGMLFGWAERKIRERLLVFLAIGASFANCALLAVRGSPYEVLTLCLSASGILWVLGSACGLRFRKARRSPPALPSVTLVSTALSSQPQI